MLSTKLTSLDEGLEKQRVTHAREKAKEKYYSHHDLNKRRQVMYYYRRHHVLEMSTIDQYGEFLPEYIKLQKIVKTMPPHLFQQAISQLFPLHFEESSGSSSPSSSGDEMSISPR